jgi:hypothetical protein
MRGAGDTGFLTLDLAKDVLENKQYHQSKIDMQEPLLSLTKELHR